MSYLINLCLTPWFSTGGSYVLQKTFGDIFGGIGELARDIAARRTFLYPCKHGTARHGGWSKIKVRSPKIGCAHDGVLATLSAANRTFTSDWIQHRHIPVLLWKSSRRPYGAAVRKQGRGRRSARPRRERWRGGCRAVDGKETRIETQTSSHSARAP